MKRSVPMHDIAAVGQGDEILTLDEGGVLQAELTHLEQPKIDLDQSGVLEAELAHYSHDFLLDDHWRRIFDKYDTEGFGEISRAEFETLLRDPEFVRKLNEEQLHVNLEGTMRKLRILGQEKQEIRFLDFVSAISRKRRLSFKCAVHYRDRQISCADDIKHFQVCQRQQEDEIKTNWKQRSKLRLFQCLLPRTWTHPYLICHQTPLHYPFVIIVLTLAQLALFANYMLRPDCFLDALDFNPESPSKSEFWRFYSYCLAHRDWEQILVTVLLQVMIGLPLESIYGSVRIFVLYLLGVLGGSLLCSGLDPEATLSGASGGRICLVTSLLVTWVVTNSIPDKSSSSKLKWVRIAFLTSIISLDFGVTVYQRHLLESTLPSSYCGHVSGLLFGILTGCTVMKKFDQPWKEDRKILGHYFLLFGLMVFALFSQLIFKRKPMIFLKKIQFEDE